MQMEFENAEVSSFVARLQPFSDLVLHSYGKLVDFEKNYQAAAHHVANTDRELRIAIVGQVKAGKSSFLNSLLFDGEEILPKAVTPKTAALTIIRWGDKLRAEIEYYNADEWQEVLHNESCYQQRVAQERERLLREQDHNKVGLFRYKPMNVDDLTDEYIVGKGSFPEIYISSHELVSMVRSAGIRPDDYLGSKVVLEASDANDLSIKLNDYVGANGKFTPLVKCSYLYYNHPALDGVEIVDTPGLNDPVLSRGRLTRQFLAKCDVAFLLSYSGQFLDQTDMNLLHEQLPESGIRKVVVLGSKFDLLLKGECRKFAALSELLDNLEPTLRKRAEDEVKKRLDNAVTEHERKLYSGMLENFSYTPVQFISAVAFSASRHFSELNNDEHRLVDELNNLYPGTFVFDEETLLDFSNLGETSTVRNVLDQQRSEKEQIIAKRIEDFLCGQKESFIRVKQDIKTDALRSKDRLDNESIQSLTARGKSISSRLKAGGGQISLAFETEISSIQKRLSLLLSDMKSLSLRFSQLDVRSEAKVEYYTVSTSKWWNPFSWFSSETRSRTVTYRYAEAHEAIDRVQQYVAESELKLKKEVISLIDLPGLQKKAPRRFEWVRV